MKELCENHASPVYLVEFKLFRQKRKTLSIQISDQAEVYVKAPQHMSINQVKLFVDNKQSWIRKQQQAMEEKIILPVLLPSQKGTHGENVRQKTLAFLENYPGEKPQRIFIRYSKSRWGSCSSLKNISLNGYLDFLPEEIFTYVLCHELTHLIHLNHSQTFWETLDIICPNTKELRIELNRYKLPTDL